MPDSRDSAVIDFIVWLALGYGGALPLEWLDGIGDGGWALFAVQFSVAVLVVACPCGIGLAAPTAQLVGVGLAAKHGILLKGGAALEAIRGVDAVVLDKTGTLTTSEFTVSDHRLAEGVDASRLFSIVRAAEMASTHPLALGLQRFCAEQLAGSTAPSVQVESSEEIPGRGLVARVRCGDGALIEVAIGNAKLVVERGAAPLDDDGDSDLVRWQDEGKSVVLVALRHLDAATDSSSRFDTSSSDHRVVARFAVHDPPRAEAAFVVAQLARHGIATWIATGDNERTAIAVARAVGIPPERVCAGALPIDKRDRIKRLEAEGRTVAFCGDGINDAVALAQAAVGLAIGSGSAVALQTADVALLSKTSPLLSILVLRELGRATMRKVRLRLSLLVCAPLINRTQIKTNFAWASLYNAALLPLAAGAFYAAGRTKLPPVWAALAMALSSLSVVGNSLLLRRWTPSRSIRDFAPASARS